MGKASLLAFVLAGSCALAAACASDAQPTPVPSPVSKPTTTETFSGTVQQGGSFQYQFKVAVGGEVYVTLKSVTTVAVTADPTASPPVDAKPAVPVNYQLNVRIGQSSLTTLGLQCTNLRQVTTSAGATPQLTGQALTGTFCVDISDPTVTLPEPVSITVTIDHS